ncbi:MAG: DUF971 domain-containing protein [Chloroflexi bacterium]|nr:DUF971 domain-containing protein [Chloroflexota bacterium]
MTNPFEVNPATTPARIHADREAGTLSIEWGDGHGTTYGVEALRWLCPCAYCRGEAGMPGWLDSAPTLTPDQTKLTDLHLVGNYALSPHWADGHATGYYPFRLLRDRCPCVVCTARRTDKASSSSSSSGPATSPAMSRHGEHR